MDTQGLVQQRPASGVNIPSNTTIEQAKLGLEHRQKQQGYIRGHHSAALFNSIGDVITSSEDVGRHSALDKLIGEAVLQRQSLDNVFAMVTSRCSHDLIIKCRRAGIPCLVTLAPPTNLAVQSSVQVGLTLFCYQQSALKRFA
jgi:FdhD protein